MWCCSCLIFSRLYMKVEFISWSYFVIKITQRSHQVFVSIHGSTWPVLTMKLEWYSSKFPFIAFIWSFIQSLLQPLRKNVCMTVRGIVGIWYIWFSFLIPMKDNWIGWQKFSFLNFDRWNRKSLDFLQIGRESILWRIYWRSWRRRWQHRITGSWFSLQKVPTSSFQDAYG